LSRSRSFVLHHSKAAWLLGGSFLCLPPVLESGFNILHVKLKQLVFRDIDAGNVTPVDWPIGNGFRLVDIIA